MRQPDLVDLDLNLLRVLLALYEEGSVSAAGQSLDLAQSTVSHALKRLRDQFADPLFVRSRRGMQPTSLAVRLATAVGESFNLMQVAVDEGRAFVPERSRRSFVLLMIDVGEVTFIPRLMSHLRQIAPQVQLTVRRLPLEMYKEELETGGADLAIGQLPDGNVDLKQQILFEVPFQGYARRGHPILQDPSLERFLDARHLVVERPTMAELFTRRALGPLAGRRKVAFRTTHYLTAAAVLAETDLVAVLPVSIGQSGVLREEMDTFPLPFEMEPVTMRQFWHPRATNDSGNRWLRSEIARLFRRPTTE